MIGGLHWPEIILILVVLVLVFGVGRISKIGGELGSGIKAFKEGLNGKKESEEENKSDETKTS
ncbi:MAG TPA: twin-arginine translocase TatA/TatE family subunit [Anaerolineaceae bacterium]|jgi:sec-independent protein translocase protein TatA|nr:twin-arginine translocase TatA/TatE family subunit [Anaerolineaceae bacterium]